MGRVSVTRVGEGGPPRILAESRREWAEAEAVFRTDGIERSTDWTIHDHRHTVVVHLGGRMDWLETEMEGHGGSSGSALPGEVWTVPAGRRYASHARGGRIEYAVIRFDPAMVPFADGSRDGRRDLAARAGTPDEWMLQEMGRLKAAFEGDDDGAAMEREAVFSRILVHLAHCHSPDGGAEARRRSSPRLDAAMARRLRAFITERLDCCLSLGELAAVVGLTTHHFLDAFREAFGESPAQYIIGQRLREARRLLTTTRRDLTGIALDCGFSSHSHFSSTFRRRLGTTPSEYRAKGLP